MFSIYLVVILIGLALYFVVGVLNL